MTQKTEKTVLVEHITRVEGHGNILATLCDGKIADAMFSVVEGIRFFESILTNRNYDEVSHIASRICGICAVSHSLASLAATENAMKITVSEQTKLLRRLIMNAEQISSHALHAYFLAAPDFLGLKSVLPLINQNPEAVKRAYRLKKTSYDLGNLIGGRHTHPISLVPGGFTEIPTEKPLEEMLARFVALRDDVNYTVELYKTLKLPQLQRDTEYVCLRQPEYYTFTGGDIVSSDGATMPAERYREAAKEYVVDISTAKWARWNRDSYMVGALARVNNNYSQLLPGVKQAAEALGLKPICTNPYMNTVAQVVELAHCIEDSIMLMEQLLNKGLQQERPSVKPQAGEGVGIVEAPRGMLIHNYTYNEKGKCVKANCIIPTGQNLANLNLDMKKLVSESKDKSKEQLQQLLEMLVRAYDPCISCSTH